MKYRTVQVLGGECIASSQDDVLLTAVLGSCVAVCLFDPTARIGGMNHYLLPLGDDSASEDARLRYGSFAIRTLIRRLENRGAKRVRMRAKLYGGGRMFPSNRDIGELNSQLALDAMRGEHIPILDANLGGRSPRTVFFHPTTGRVSLKVAGSTNAT